MNIGRFQVLYWPRWTLFLWRPRYCRGVYDWVVFVWPIEVRRFSTPAGGVTEDTGQRGEQS